MPVRAIPMFELITLHYILDIHLPGFHLRILIRKTLDILVMCYQAADSIDPNEKIEQLFLCRYTFFALNERRANVSSIFQHCNKFVAFLAYSADPCGRAV